MAGLKQKKIVFLSVSTKYENIIIYIFLQLEKEENKCAAGCNNNNINHN